jgi:DNA helicase-2/ATP-dependent DNA helicase PcrA
VDNRLDELNPAQRAAVEHGHGPLLIIAGAGSGKTATLAHRVAELIARGADPRRVLLLTFTRRAAAEMTRRAQLILHLRRAQLPPSASAGSLSWAGTFHSIANRLLRIHATAIGLDPSFTVLDREDSADLLDLTRHQLGLAKTEKRFPRKATCLAIYSRVVNAQAPLADCLRQAFPYYLEWEAQLRQLFAAYVEAKRARHVLDFDDLLLYWWMMMGEPALAAKAGERFDHVLVDEYQDTNRLQADILRKLKPDGAGVTVVGDDAQSIYSFRAAAVRNILDFPSQYDPPATVVTLEQNYRSSQPILDASNATIGLASQRFTKDLFSTRKQGRRPLLVTVNDENEQVRYVAEQVLAAREAGLPLKRQAVLFRAAHHSDALEVELVRRNIPFVKYGGLRFLEAAHIKDLLGILRWAENPRDETAAFRTLQLLDGMGPAGAGHAWQWLAEHGFELPSLSSFAPAPAARTDWPPFCALLLALRSPSASWPAQIAVIRRWYEPRLEALHGEAQVRRSDLEQLEQIAGGFENRERFLSELTLDPPSATGAEAGPPHLDEDYLILSTIHSAKGQEWDAVFVLNVVDGCIPSDMATGTPEEIEEERRLLYVAMTRAKSSLHLLRPLRFFVRQQSRWGDRHVIAPLSRFLPGAVLDRFERLTVHPPGNGQAADGPAAHGGLRIDVGARLQALWGPLPTAPVPAGNPPPEESGARDARSGTPLAPGPNSRQPRRKASARGRSR